MERVAPTANLSIRYGRSFENEASSSSMRNSDDDVDFDDVFGGPPTRTRYSFGGSRIKSSEESTSSPARLSEKPVFGESYSSPRKQTGDDFYNDIFRRSDESVRSPRWRSPSSRTLSPANIEPFGTSLPAEFSLPAKMTKAVDIPIFGSNVHTPNASLTRFSSGQTLLSRESSSVKESSYTTRSKQDEVDQKSTSEITKTGSPSSEFHFSIHKWANVGVPLLMSIRGGIHPTMKGSSKVSSVSTDNMTDSGFTNNDLSIKKDDINLPKTGVMEINEKETVIVKQDLKEPEVIPVAPSSLLHDEIERQGYEDAGKEVEKKEKADKKKKRVEAKKTSSSKKVEANKPKTNVLSPKSSPKSRVKGMVKEFFKKSNILESPPKTKTNVSSRWKTNTRNRTQEEVDDIISKLDTSVPDTNLELKPEASKTTKVDSELHTENVKIDPDDSRTKSLDSKFSVDNVEKIPDASFMVKEQVERVNKQKTAKNRTIRKLEDINFQKDTSPASESVPFNSKANVEKIDDFEIEELAPMEDKLSKTQEESEAIMVLDSKIHTWSSGRKGNIRSLLSTLQLVLWAESGWKPVALVDIIESNAVKKAYNRAMLCLHPDKLQQKGADAHKKYMAEKVFDILQEAWDHFNTLGTLL